MADPGKGPMAPRPTGLPADLEARISAFERTEPRGDFDAASWFWMILLGMATPLVLWAVGWWA